MGLAFSGVIVQELKCALYGNASPFDASDLSKQDWGYPHTNLIPGLISALFAYKVPTFILECGSMLGGSAICMAQEVKKQAIEAGIVCVDPFTGDVNMWEWEQDLTRENKWRFLGLENGVPTIYSRFLANCKAKDCDDIILPINATSIVGMKLIKRLYDKGKITSLPNYIYLDSAHEPDETFLELQVAWNTLPNGGILFGDDWSWESVRNDVLKFNTFVDGQCDPAFAGITDSLPGSCMEGNVLLYQGQWALRKS